MTKALIEQRALRLRVIRYLAWAGATVLVGIASAVLASRLGLPRWIAGLDVAAVLTFGAAAIRRRPITPRSVAMHLDRVMPEFEESATLLLSSNDDVLARLQRGRVEARTRNATSARLPVPATRPALVIVALASLAILAALVIPPSAPSSSNEASAAPVAAAPLAIDDIALSWVPPRYTGRGVHLASSRNITVEEGSLVRWHVLSPGAERVAIVTSHGDTIAARISDSGWVATARGERALLWHVIAERDTQAVRSADHLVSVTPDHPPLLSVISPPARIAIGWDEPHLVDARALVSDDYGIGTMRLIATVASGRGEGVKFRERTFDVEIESRRGPASLVVARRIALDSLAIAPGDEVMLAFEASDRREPTSQTARSETIFISILDTLEAATGELAGISLRVEPAYFRSQRQIIIDTETLLRDMRRGAGGDTLRRSMDIGYDQHLLRLRYGELVGEETEGMGNADEHAHESDAPVTAEDFRHNHDMEENATLLGTSVKDLLKRALAAMWESEKHLRIGNARAALPHEYRALEALEEIRRASRAYVKRIGFEPPAIDVAKVRLTKEARNLGAASREAAVQPEDPDAALRIALRALGDRGTAVQEPLEAAADRLAARIVAGESMHLETMGLLRRVIDGCTECIDELRQLLTAALPSPPPAFSPARRTRGGLRSTP